MRFESERRLQIGSTDSESITAFLVAGDRNGFVQGLRPQGEEGQGQRADHQHVVGEVEDGETEIDRIDMKVDEITDMSEEESIVAVPQAHQP